MSDKLDAVIKKTEREYMAIADEIGGTIINALNTATDFESFQKNLEKLAVRWQSDNLALNITLAAYEARMQGYFGY